jgi:Icc-related predicted phosphoesterase
VTVRLAAVGDIHVGTDSAGVIGRALAPVNDDAHVLLLAGDLTRNGRVEEARVLAAELALVEVPVVAVLGNHDFQCDQQDEITQVLQEAGVTVLDCSTTVLEVAGTRLGVAGTKGFGGGFVGECASDYGEPEMKAFVRHTKAIANGLSAALAGLRADARIVLLHYSPVAETLRGEPVAIYPFLGSYLLAEAIDAHGADLVLHGHAHAGSERGLTAGGCPVRNVAQPVIKRAYRLFCLGHTDGDGCESVPMRVLTTAS